MRGPRRSYKYAYMESIKTTSDSTGENPQTAIKQAMIESLTKDGKTKSHYIDAENVQSWSDDLSGVPHGRPVENLDEFLKSRNSDQFDLWSEPLRNIRNYMKTQGSPKEVTPDEVLRATTAEPVDEIIIDPITNRRVRRSIAAASFTPKYEDVDRYAAKSTPEDESNQYEDLDKYEPVSYDDPNTQQRKLTPEEESKQYEDLDKYEPVSYDDPTEQQRKLTPEEESKQYEDLDKYEPTSYDDPNEQQRKLTPEEESKQYEDLDKYKPKNLDDPFTPRELTPEEESKQYEDLDKYRPTEHDDPFTPRELTPEEKSKQYEDLDKYRPTEHDDPLAPRELTPEEKSKIYDDLKHYRAAVQWNEPFGQPDLTPEEQSKSYEDLHEYKEGFKANDSILEAHEQAQMDPTPRGRPMPAAVAVTVEDFQKKYDDLQAYGPIKWNEPDGLPEPTVEELSKNYEDLHKYGPVRWNEPDGLPDLTTEQMSKNYQDLPGYRESNITESAHSQVQPEEMSKNYQDLAEYAKLGNSELDKPWIQPEQTSKNYEDLHLYSSGVSDASVTERIHPEELSKNYTDLDKYDPQQFDSPLASDSFQSEQTSKKYADLGKYQPVMHNEPDGLPSQVTDTVGSGLKSYDEKISAQSERAFSTHYDESENLTADQIRASVLERAQLRSDEHKLADAKNTGIYTMDFPQDFATSRSTSNSPIKSTLLPSNQEYPIKTETETETADQEEAVIGSMDECFPSEGVQSETTLSHRGYKASVTQKERTAVKRDPYSTEPQGLELSYAEETGQPTTPALVKHYRNAKSEQESSETAPPTSYVVLAYDPASQSINVAEASSTVIDNASPLAPTDVLLRLSNPSKFLPHFRPLQSQGYEIVSGNGDVLVFRKVRSSTEASEMASTIGPTDMMGGQTGTVESPEVAETATPRFKSNIDVRREEPVFSGRRPEPKPKRRLGRRVMLGTAGVMGGAYAVGVLAEYFSTGGLDGLGPRGL